MTLANGKGVGAHAFDSEHFFPGYVFRYSRTEDVAEVTKIIAGEGLEDSKRQAVYPRDPSLVNWAVSNGLFTIIERHAMNERELALLGQPSKIVAITGMYPLGLDEHGHQRRFPVENTNKGGHPISRFVVEVGSTRYLKENDLPNALGHKPANCFYLPIVAGVVAKIFHLAGREVGDRVLNVDAITANVQTREPMIDIMTRLQAPPLGFVQIRPASELKEYTGSITQGEAFQTMDKNFYSFPAQALPDLAMYMLQCVRAGMVSSDTGMIINTVGMRFEIEGDLIKTLDAVARRAGSIIQEPKGVSMTDVRERLNPSIPVNDAVIQVQASPSVGENGIGFAKASQQIVSGGMPTPAGAGGLSPHAARFRYYPAL